MYELVIQNTRIFNHSIGSFENVNIGIKDGKIERISKYALEGEKEINASGLLTIPGFIDIHAHEDTIDLEEMRVDQVPKLTAKALLNMGVTTMVGGNCGISAWPIDEYLQVTSKELDITYLTYAGHSTLRRRVGISNRYRRADQKGINQMVNLAREAMEQGAIGISFGLEYVPGSSEKEVFELAKVAGEYDGLITAHVRYDSARILEGIEEIASAGQRYNVPVQISHLGSMASFGYMQQSLDFLEDKSSKMDIMADSYPYYAFCTSIGSAVFDAGFPERWKCGYEDIQIAAGKYKGKRCDRNLFERMREKEPETSVVAHVLDKEEVQSAIKHPLVIIGSDGSVRDGTGSHPRVAGTFPKIFDDYVGNGLMPLEEAIRKTSTQTAFQLRLADKGEIALGKDADLVIFDLDKIKAKASFENTTASPDGIKYVICEGRILP